MRKLIPLLLLAFAAGSAQAQIKCWTDANGKRTCGDTPPPGAKVQTLKNPASGAAPAPAAKDGKDAKDAKKGPLTAAEQEQEFRKRRAESEKTAAEEAKKREAAEAKKEDCARAREYMSSIEAGQRIQRTNAQGERYVLDEKQMEGEKARAQESIKASCG